MTKIYLIIVLYATSVYHILKFFGLSCFFTIGINPFIYRNLSDNNVIWFRLNQFKLPLLCLCTCLSRTSCGEHVFSLVYQSKNTCSQAFIIWQQIPRLISYYTPWHQDFSENFKTPFSWIGFFCDLALWLQIQKGKIRCHSTCHVNAR